MVKSAVITCAESYSDPGAYLAHVDSSGHPPRHYVAMAPKAKAKKTADAPAVPAETTHAAAHAAPKEADHASKSSDTLPLVFGVDLDAPGDIEDDSTVLAPIAKFAILGMICLMSFAIRLFAVVRYESVCCVALE